MTPYSLLGLLGLVLSVSCATKQELPTIEELWEEMDELRTDFNKEREMKVKEIQDLKNLIKKQDSNLKRLVNKRMKTVNTKFEYDNKRMNNIESALTKNNEERLADISAVREDMNKNAHKESEHTEGDALSGKIIFSEVTKKIQDFKTEIKTLVLSVNENVTINRNALFDYKYEVKKLARQTMMQQFGTEERSRTSGDSGVKLVRGLQKGPENFYEAGLFGPQFNMIHDHSDYIDTVGMGETFVVMNGVEFMTRHNDYKFRMASTTDKSFHAVERVPFPEVPESVTDLPEVSDQCAEMREYFRAFREQNTSIRNYTEYFKPVLCYLEGAWYTASDKFDEPFESDRHSIDADGWLNLQAKIRYSRYTGTKSRLENFSYLPTTITGINETTGKPQYAQWNYRVLCQPLKDDIPLKSLVLQDDLAYRVPKKQRKKDVWLTRGARFKVEDPMDMPNENYRLIDRLMAQVPGKDNNNFNLTQQSFGEYLFESKNSEKILNTGYYHRAYSYSTPGAMGLKGVSRGYSDNQLWVAQTTQEKVAPVKIKECKPKPCVMKEIRMSYAIPLEIIYLTPLMSWNPHNLETVDRATAKGLEADCRRRRCPAPRNGENSTEKAFKGVAEKDVWYRTPVEFYSGKLDGSDPADTVRNSVAVLDRMRKVRMVTASGMSVNLRPIQGVDRIRLRFPISPVHGEGSVVWKELNALKYALTKNQHLLEEGSLPIRVYFELSSSANPHIVQHRHQFSISLEEYFKATEEGQELVVETTVQAAHRHHLKIRYFKQKKSSRRWQYTWCGPQLNMKSCHDRHPTRLMILTELTDEIVEKMREKVMAKSGGNVDGSTMSMAGNID